MLYKNRQKLSKQNEKIGKTFSKLPLSPNQWTLISLLAAVASAYFITQNNYICAAVFFAIAALCDVIDGSVARYRNIASPKGGHIDNIADRYVELIVILGLMFASLPLYYIDSRVWLLLLLFGSMMTTYAKASAAEQMNKQIKGGILERGERMILIFVGLLAGIVSKDLLLAIISLAAVLSNITAAQRIIMSFKTEKK